MKISKPKIVISGASGFTGRNLIHKLNPDKYEFLLLKRDSNSAIPKTLYNFQEIEFVNLGKTFKEKNYNNIQAVIHLATVYSRRENKLFKKDIWDANYFVGLSLLEMAISSNALFCHIESYLQYEDEPKTIYLESKLAFSELVERERKKESADILSLVFFDNYGHGDNRQKILDELIGEKIKGNKIKLENPEKVIICSSIEDVCTAMIKAIDSRRVGRWRVNSDDKFYVQQISDFISSYPDVDRPLVIKNEIYRAEALELLDSFTKNINVFDYLDFKLRDFSKK